MEIQKRNGMLVPFTSDKIKKAISKAFIGTEIYISDESLIKLTLDITSKLEDITDLTVEKVQDIVELTLMESGYYKVAKAYILYRERRAEMRSTRYAIAKISGFPDLEVCLRKIQKDFSNEIYPLSALQIKYLSFYKENESPDSKALALIKAAVELTTITAPKWEYIGGILLNFFFQRNVALDMEEKRISNLYEKIVWLTNKGLYGDYILSSYSKAEILEAEAFIDKSRDDLFTYSGLDLLLKRYVIRTRKNIPIETPQEMFLGIALHLAINERENRLSWVKRFYDILSKMEITVATPTLSNARKPNHQLSSCFIDTVPDSLDGIYRSIDNFAKVSKFGGGMGLYFGKVRANGSMIRGFEGAAGGVIRWIKLANDTAIAVDQLGVRQGSVAVYLDAWHKDLPEFLQIRTNNGDDRLKAHDVFPAVCYPDLFWRLAKEDIDSSWYLMCPHDILSVKGYSLEDFYGEEWEKRYNDCVRDNRISKRIVTIKDIVRLVLRSAVETGTPFAFFRDTVNKMNPNPHTGIIYSSNLCTEIAQNMSPITHLQTSIETRDGETVIVSVTKPGDFVVCNLASLVLGNLPTNNDQYMQNTIDTAIRALDNVIDLNFYPIEYSKLTNKAYRSIGLGISGYHHTLANNRIKWESDEHLKFVDELFEKINYYAINASKNLAKEKGIYDYFNGSDWENGEYFKKRGYTTNSWKELSLEVKKYGMRNAYLLAIAPTSSTSIIAGTSAGVDPILNKFFIEEKKGSMLPRVAPNLSQENFWLYKNAHHIDQKWSVKACGIRQRHIDQSQSINLYITNDYTMRQVLDLYICAWESGVKTIYYVRSKSLEIEECESCSS